MTVASARTTRGRGGSPRSKSIRRRWTPEPSVRARERLRALRLASRPGRRARHQGTNVPKTKSSRFGGRKEAGVALTRQLTSAPGSAPPA